MCAKTNAKKMVTKDFLVADIVKGFPLIIDTMQEHGIQFIGKHIARKETIEQAAAQQKANIFNLIEDINNKIKYQTG